MLNTQNNWKNAALTLSVLFSSVSSIQALTVDFSDYTAPGTLIEGTSPAGTDVAASSLDLIDSENSNYYRVTGRTSTQQGASYAATVKSGTGGNFLEMTDSATSGSQSLAIYGTSAFDPTQTDTLATWTTDFNISASGNGNLKFGLFAMDALDAGYTIDETQEVGANLTSVGLSLMISGNGDVRVLRTGNDTDQLLERFTLADGWADGRDASGATLSEGTNYRVIISVNTFSGEMSLELLDQDTPSTVLNIASSVGDLGSNASTGGGFRYSGGNLEVNAGRNWTVGVDSLSFETSAIPEPSASALLLGGILFVMVGFRRSASMINRMWP